MNLSKENRIELNEKDKQEIKDFMENFIRAKYKKFRSFNVSNILLLKDDKVCIHGANCFFNLFAKPGEIAIYKEVQYVGAFSFEKREGNELKKLKKLTMKKIK